MSLCASCSREGLCNEQNVPIVKDGGKCSKFTSKSLEKRIDEFLENKFESIDSYKSRIAELEKQLIEKDRIIETYKKAYETEHEGRMKALSALFRDPQDYWSWVGDGTDNINTMSNDMPVLIRAEDLRSLLDKVLLDKRK